MAVDEITKGYYWPKLLGKIGMTFAQTESSLIHSPQQNLVSASEFWEVLAFPLLHSRETIPSPNEKYDIKQLLAAIDSNTGAVQWKTEMVQASANPQGESWGTSPAIYGQIFSTTRMKIFSLQLNSQ